MNTQIDTLEEVQATQVPREAWVEMIVAVARMYDLTFSQESVNLISLWTSGASQDESIREVALRAGLDFKAVKGNEIRKVGLRLPILLQLNDGALALVESPARDGFVKVRFSGDMGLSSEVSKESLFARAQRAILLRPSANRVDARVDGYIKGYQKNWFWDAVLHDIVQYKYVALASLVINLLGISGVLFSMQVYDRVVPANSLPTLYVLFVGVVIAAAFDLLMRIARAHVTEVLGKRADYRVSDKVFGHALRIKTSARPHSTGAFIAQLRDLEQVRELVATSTITGIADLPFFFFFVAILWLLVGPLALIPVAALVLMVTPSLLAQRKLARLANKGMRESSLRNGLLVESIQGLEDIKSLQAEAWFQKRWNQYNVATAESNLELKELTHKLTYWGQVLQALVFALMIVVGAPMVMAGDLTTGALVAASILSSRMMAPLAQVTGILTRWQQAKTALKGLDGLMVLPTDYPPGAHLVHSPRLSGEYSLDDAVFGYGASAPVLHVRKMRIRAGEKIVVLGRNGAGKSTFLSALAGEMESQQGSLILDGVSVKQLDPADLRRDVFIFSQHSRLFHGTIRDNLLMGAPLATDDEMRIALSMAGAETLMRALSFGLDHVITEGGYGLSGGQRQAVLLARMFLRNPSVVLLDEPSAALDDEAERNLVRELLRWGRNKTLIIATHRKGILQLAQRVIVLQDGIVAHDVPKDAALKQMGIGE